MRYVGAWVLGAWLSACAGTASKGGETPGSPPVSALPIVPVMIERHPAETPPGAGSFGDDVAFLQRHTEIRLLKSAEGRSQVAVAPEYQGRVMTSTANGAGGTSFGWIHRKVIEQHARQPHMTVLGGEDRFWLGPEGGQFGLYFPPGAPFEFSHWQVPEAIDWGSWAATSESETEVVFEKTMELENHSGTRFSIAVRRTVRILDPSSLAKHLGVTPGPSTRGVGFESDNVITNSGRDPWKRDTGLVSVWILGMFTPSEATTVAIPIKPGSEQQLGPPVNDDYFGSVPPDRLRVTDRAVFFRADGGARGKIGIPPPRALPVAGSYDGARGVLTLVQYTLPASPSGYVDSRWAQQHAPYAGDVINSYNDGPPEPGAPPMGPFYEIESSSPGAALKPGESLRHVHRTIHLEGPEADLDRVARKQLGVPLETVRQAFTGAAP